MDKPLVIVDVDGTVALRVGPEARGPFDYDRVLEDRPNVPVIATVEALHAAGHPITFLSGRESVPGCHDDTAQWLFEHLPNIGHFELYMRPHGDHRRDWIVKYEMYREFIAPRPVLLVLDDRPQVVRLWRDLGITCLQVAPGPAGEQ